MSTTQPAETTQPLEFVTAYRPFSFVGLDQTEGLFAVRAGIPMDRAHEELSSLLGVARAAMSDAMGNGPDGAAFKESGWAAVHLVVMAEALAGAIFTGILDGQRMAQDT